MRGRERGHILAVTAMVVTALLGFAGLIVDVGLLYAERRQAQNAADEATLAAAHTLLEGGSTSSATAAAFEYAQANGYPAEAVTVNIPPSSGEHVGDTDFVEVIVQDDLPTFFIHVLTSGGASAQGRAVGGTPVYPAPYAVVVLEESNCDAFRVGGNASMTLVGGGIMVNSSCPSDALSKSGSGDLLVEGSIDVYGGSVIGGSGTVSPDPRSVGWTVEDPLASVPPPARTLPPAPGSPGTPENPQTWRYNNSAGLTLWPGTYYGGFSSNCVCTITLMPGTYVMSGGGFTKGGGANFVGDGVTIYVTTNPTESSGDGGPEPFSMTGTGVLDLSPPTSGIYQGITLWQDVVITDDISMTGSNDFLSGVLYAPGAELDISGDSQFGTVQLIVNEFRLSGNAPLDLTYGEFRPFEAPDVALVE